MGYPVIPLLQIDQRQKAEPFWCKLGRHDVTQAAAATIHQPSMHSASRKEPRTWGISTASRLDRSSSILRDERLWRGSDVVRLKPKALAVLRCLLTHVGQLVTKEVLFATVWPDTVVSDAV